MSKPIFKPLCLAQFIPLVEKIQPMKSIFKVFILALFFISQFQAESFAQNNSAEVFNIYIGAFVTAKQEDFKSLQKLGYVYAKKMDNKLLQIYLGAFNNRSTATKALKKVKAIGFTDAFLSKRSLGKGKQVPVIQLAHRELNEEIDWANFLRAGNLYLLSLDKTLKITTGRFKTVEEAKSQLTQIKALGFKDAFVKMVNTFQVHKVTPFDTQGAKAAKMIVLEEPEIVEVTDEVLEKEEELVSKGGESLKEYDVIAFKKAKKEIDFSLPNIRAKTKRISVMNLQRVLMAERTYKGPVDGYYGSRTAYGYEIAIKHNRQIKKYKVLADNLAPAATKAETDMLQYAINNLIDNPTKAFEGLKKSNTPIAKAYLAYGFFRKDGAQKKVDQLMNQAIKTAFKAKKLENAAPFDYQATYSYQDLGQLILHLSYIHAVSNKEAAVPCWLFQEHPKEAQKAFEERMGGNYTVEACERFDAWSEIKLLQTIAADINPDRVSDANMKNAMSNLSRLATSSKGLGSTMQKDLEDWHTNLWNGLDAWAGKDDLHLQMTRALKLAYYQSQVRLEDYYMNKGFKKEQAMTLALASLKSLVDHQLQRYY